MDLLLRVDEGLHRCKRLDFMDILLIPNFNKTPSNDPADWWDESETNLWTDWDAIAERQALYW